MTDQTKNAPLEVLRDGALKAAIWKNEGEKGAYFTTTLSKTFEKNGKLRDGNNFTGTELLRVSELARYAYAKIRKHRAATAQERSGSEGDASAPESPVNE